MKSNLWKVVIVVALIAAVTIVIVGKNKNSKTAANTPAVSVEIVQKTNQSTATAESDGALCPKFDSSTVAQSNTPKGVEDSAKTAAILSEKPKRASGQPERKLPKLVDLGSTTCIPCKMMATVLEQLSKEYPGALEVVFIDVKEREKAAAYKIRAIPTQILYDQNGKEIFRHEGFLSKESILKKFKEHGIELASS